MNFCNTYYDYKRSGLILFTVIFFVLSVSARTKDIEDERTYLSGTFFDRLEKMTRFRQPVQHVGIKTNLSLVSVLQSVFQMKGNVLENAQRGQSQSDIFSPKLIKALGERFMRIEMEAKDNNPNDTTPSCTNDVLRMVNGFVSAQPWAVSFLDAAGKPGPSITKGWLHFVGNYDQCIESKAPPVTSVGPGFNGKYCDLLLKIPKDPVPGTIGLCVPSTCSSEEVTSFFRQLISMLQTSSFSIHGVECHTGETTMTTATVLAIIILSIVGFLVILGTCYEVFVVKRDVIWASKLDREEEEEKEERLPGPSCLAPEEKANYDVIAPVKETTPLITKEVKTQSPQGTVTKFLLAFSLYSNGKLILSTSTPQGSITCIHGMRFLSMSWVVLGHTAIFGVIESINLPTALQSFLNRWTFDAVLNGTYAVDTFFTLSGLLTSYITMKQLWSRGVRINWAMFYFHRLWRLTPPYMFVLVIVLGLQQYLGHGPLWSDTQPADKMYCEKNWWTNLLYINNFVDPQEPCFIHSWYLANDMQFFLISPIMLIPFYYSKLAGLATCVCLLVISWIATGVLSTYFEMGVTLLSATQHHYFDMYYIKPWSRIGPYVIGIIAGYILAVKKGRPFKMRIWVVACGWLISTASALAVIYGIDGSFDEMGERPVDGNVAVNALYNTVGKSVWAACVCWVIIACTAGYGGPVNAILSWSPFLVLGRLTYMTYLIHISIINVFIGNVEYPFFMNDSNLTILFLGLFAVSNMAAFVGSLLLESPMLGIERAFLRR